MTAWTAPATFVALATLPASQLNIEVRDHLLAIREAFGGDPGAGGIGTRKYALCSSQLLKNADITLADVPGLVVAIGANETWSFRFFVRGISTTTADWRFAVTAPAAPTAFWAGVLGSMDVPTTASSVTPGASIFGGGAGVDETLTVQGLIRNGASAGNLQLQMAQLTSNASNTVVYADSFVIADRVA